MLCAQRGCELDLAAILEAGLIPAMCPTCQHPLVSICVSPEELSDASGIPVEPQPTDPEAPIDADHMDLEGDNDGTQA